MPRITPITAKSELPAEHHAVADAIMKVFGRIRGPFSMLLHSPKLALRTNRVDQATFDALKKRYSAQWLVELTAAACYFAFVSGIANAFEVPAPPDGDKLP